MAKKVLFSFEVKPGMVIAEDLYNPAGQLVLPGPDLFLMKLQYPSWNTIPFLRSLSMTALHQFLWLSLWKQPI